MSSYARLQEKSRYDDTTGVLSNTGDVVSLDCTGTSSAVFSVTGTFEGKILIHGNAGGSDNTKGERLAFLTGVGSLGTNLIVNTGGTWDKQFRLATGGSTITLEAVDWVSGSASIVLSVSSASSAVFVNGPVHNAGEESTRAGNAYLASTSVIELTAIERLYVKLENPIDSGKDVFLNRRVFSGNRRGEESVLEYRMFLNPTLALSNVSSGINMKFGNPNASCAMWSYEIANPASTDFGGTEGTGGFIPQGGNSGFRPLNMVIPRGFSLGLVVSGAESAVGQTTKVSISVEWHEEISVT